MIRKIPYLTTALMFARELGFFPVGAGVPAGEESRHSPPYDRSSVFSPQTGAELRRKNSGPVSLRNDNSTD
jgi:hypothetical protein